jgi:hypothetical protein
MNEYSIVITTFDQRFTTFLRPLISTIKTLRPKIEVIVMVNGPANANFDPNYRSSLLQFLASQENCYPTMFPNFQALAKLWNRGAITATNSHILVLNDDLEINCALKPNFFDAFEGTLETEIKTFKINGSFSHFCLNKDELIDVGFFDERLLGIGEEDGDFTWRYYATYGQDVTSINLPGITNIQSRLADSGFAKGIGHYSKFNRDFIKNDKYQEVLFGGHKGMFDKRSKKKLMDEIQYPYERFYLKNRHKL